MELTLPMQDRTRTPDHPAPAQQPILRPGDTCRQIARADRFALIVDAADYFARVKEAMLNARHSILLIGWDFDLRIRLTPEEDGEGGQIRLGDFLKKLVHRTPSLRIHILKWDMAVLFTMGWQVIPMMLTDIVGTRRIHLRFDSTHPSMAAHHQKIVVIDDAIAFCGGIDMTAWRWDTRAHKPDDPRRTDPSGRGYGPWHDSTTAVDGEAARALGKLARERWCFATGQMLDKPDSKADLWPDALIAQLHDVDVGIARTMPAYEDREAVHEIEALYLAAIRAARRSIYIESQFFCSSKIADAVAARLTEEDGPEIVVVNPESAAGWLEEESMDCARALIVRRLRDLDRHDRFRIFRPVNAAGEPIYVHSKVLVIDDRLLRIGSSNVNNRSMGFDSECDLAVEATPEDPRIASAILRMRNGLLAEHLDVSPAAMAQALGEKDSLVAAVDGLRKSEGRSLRPLDVREVSEAERLLVESRLANPERPTQPETRIQHAVKRVVLRHPLAWLAGAAALTALGALGARRLTRR